VISSVDSSGPSIDFTLSSEIYRPMAASIKERKKEIKRERERKADGIVKKEEETSEIQWKKKDKKVWC
jgi:hypothetical protein